MRQFLGESDPRGRALGLMCLCDTNIAVKCGKPGSTSCRRSFFPLTARPCIESCIEADFLL